MKEFLKQKYYQTPRCPDSSSFLKRKCFPCFLNNLNNFFRRMLQNFPDIEILMFKFDFKQNFLKEMQKELLLLLLSATALALSSYSYTVGTPDVDGWATYPLGSVSSGDTITILLEFPDVTTGSNPTAFKAYILNSSFGVISQPAGFNTSVSINFQGSNTLTWNVGVSSAYYLQILPSTTLQSIVPYQLTVTSSNGSTLVKTSDIVRTVIFLKIYLASSQARYVVSRNNTVVVRNYLFPVANNILSNRPVSSSSTSNQFIYTNLPAGQYVLMLDTRSSTTVSYQSDPYACPYDPSFPDTKLLFAPCFSTASPASATASSSPSGMPIGHIILIGACSGVFVVSAVGLLIYLLKAKASNVTPQVCETTDANFNTSKPMDPSLNKRTSELIKVEVPKTVLNFQKA